MIQQEEKKLSKTNKNQTKPNWNRWARRINDECQEDIGSGLQALDRVIFLNFDVNIGQDLDIKVRNDYGSGGEQENIQRTKVYTLLRDTDKKSINKYSEKNLYPREWGK